MIGLILFVTTYIIAVNFTSATPPTNITNDDYLPYGPQVDIPTDVVFQGGWNECFVSFYADSTQEMLPDIIEKLCIEDYLMMACRQTGSSKLQLLAWAHRDDVLFNTEHEPKTHDAEGTGWYFGDDKSWGFVAAGEDINQGSCDTYDEVGYTRLCWHTQGTGGYRCGEDENLNSNSEWEKLIFQRQTI